MVLFLYLIVSLCFAVTPEQSVSAPWRIVEDDPNTYTMTHQDHTASLIVRVRNGRVGLTLSHRNRNLHTTTKSGAIPTFESPIPITEVTALRIESQGIDLVVRVEGGSIRDWTDTPSAPDDPVLTWFRVRIRNDAIRVITQGLVRFTLPASTEGPHPKPTVNESVSFTHGYGFWTFKTNAMGLEGQKTRTQWWVDTSPSIDAKQPYPKTTVEWTPSTGTPRP